MILLLLKNILEENENYQTHMEKVESKTMKYFDLFPLLEGLESERPGIKNRVWEHMNVDPDYAFKPWNGRISTINLYFYGLGEEYPTKAMWSDPNFDYLGTSEDNHPEAFEEGTPQYELRLDFNLIWSVYEDEIEDIEAFPVKVNY
jgi:hypothetical protein